MYNSKKLRTRIDVDGGSQVDLNNRKTLDLKASSDTEEMLNLYNHIYNGPYSYN